MFWTTVNSENSIEELKPGGAEIPVSYQERFDYVKMAVKAKLQESTLQC